MLPPSSPASRCDSGRPRPVPFTDGLQRILDLRELVEDAPVILRRDAEAGVRDLEQDQLPVLFDSRHVTRTEPRTVNLSALDTRLRRICETLP